MLVSLTISCKVKQGTGLAELLPNRFVFLELLTASLLQVGLHTVDVTDGTQKKGKKGW